MWLGVNVSSVVKVRFEMRFYDFVTMPASDHCRAASRTRFMTKNANLCIMHAQKVNHSKLNIHKTIHSGPQGKYHFVLSDWVSR